ncbi:PadR family transcriptional regulator [Pseudactinotalea sp.]|uniref:PadR family transcriptional regulator n=1 Tax=Pseudactinotalea sp. TaxID=1926260 RepID=UPI003B3A9E06
MAHVILGLLLIVPQSLYDLIKSFEAGVSLFYSASSGSIKRALDGLLADGHIEVISTDGPRGRKVYDVTDSGREAFRTWMTGEPTGDAETAALSRLYFLGLLPAEDRAGVLRKASLRIEAGMRQLEHVADHIAQAGIPEHQRELGHYQLATLEYGLGSYRHAVGFFDDLLERE